MIMNIAEIGHAIVKWRTEDAIEAAKHHGIELTKEQAEDWWAQNEESFRSRLVEAGKDILAEMDFSAGGLVRMACTTEHVDLSKINEHSFIRCSCELTRDHISSGIYPGVFADLYYDKSDFDTVFWTSFENNIVPEEKVVNSAYAEMVRFANKAGNNFGIPVMADREGYDLFQPVMEEKEKTIA